MGEGDYHAMMASLGPPPDGGIPTGGNVVIIPKGYGAGVDYRLATGTVPLNAWLAIQSTNVHRAHYCPWPDIDSETGRMHVEFLSLAMYRYDSVHWSLFDQFLQSPSKGQFIVYRMYFWQPRYKLRGPQRKVTKQMREANYGRVTL